MKHKIIVIALIVLAISSWINVLASFVVFGTISNPQTWDEIKVAIDLFVAMGFTMGAVLARIKR